MPSQKLRPVQKSAPGLLASFCHLGFTSDPLIVSKFHNETHDPKGQENKIHTIVKGRETIYRRHTVPVTSCSEVKYVLKRVSFGSKDCTKELRVYLGQVTETDTDNVHIQSFFTEAGRYKCSNGIPMPKMKMGHYSLTLYPIPTLMQHVHKDIYIICCSISQ